MAKWQTVYSHKAVTVCRGFDIAGAHVGDVQVVDFEAGGKMRVMSEPEPGQEIGTSDTRFDRKTGLGWFWWAQANVTSPAAAQLFSATSGSPFSLDATGRATMKFPQKKWNTLMSSGSERACHNMPELGVTGKRYFGLSDPRLPGRQTPYIDQYEDPCQSAPATATAALSGYHGRPVSLFDATVAFHPQYETSTGQGRRAFIGTRSMDGMWEGTQDRAYVFTSSSIWPGYLTVGQARALLVNDFHTMYNLQLDGASSGYHSILDGASAQDASNDESGVRGVPEVLLIYNAP
ncbi:MAG TPA: hypothetical protein VM942_05650 [Acidimicrobiales bacterium]|nr:hypothetical protein [Acidimicrobiales bacterium]